MKKVDVCSNDGLGIYWKRGWTGRVKREGIVTTQTASVVDIQPVGRIGRRSYTIKFADGTSENKTTFFPVFGRDSRAVTSAAWKTKSRRDFGAYDSRTGEAGLYEQVPGHVVKLKRRGADVLRAVLSRSGDEKGLTSDRTIIIDVHSAPTREERSRQGRVDVQGKLRRSGDRIVLR